MTWYFLQTRNLPILEQLYLEEDFLREDLRNFCLCNEGSPPSIVMGISGKSEQLLHIETVQKHQYPVIRRFSGGGTVIVDENTLFVTFICNKIDFPFPAYPEKILQWAGDFYQRILPIPGFHLKENDFVIGDKKCGGNALYIKKDRWLLHTSFLWDFSPKNMETLRHPPKTPSYRQGRPHTDFLCVLKDYFPNKTDIFALVFQGLHDLSSVVSIPLIPYSPFSKKSTSLVSL